jgi:hypothetical protein
MDDLDDLLDDLEDKVVGKKKKSKCIWIAIFNKGLGLVMHKV